MCSLTIDKALPEDEGQYRCRAESAAGRAESSCMVLVDGEPILLLLLLLLLLLPRMYCFHCSVRQEVVFQGPLRP